LLDQAREVRAEIDKIPLGSNQPVPVAPLAPAPVASPEDSLKASLLADTRRCQSAVGQCTAKDFTAVFDAMNDLLSNLSKAVRGDVKFAREQDLIVAQVAEAAELVGLLSYENNEKASKEAADTVRQITLDIWSRLPAATSGAAQNSSDPSNLSKAS